MKRDVSLFRPGRGAKKRWKRDSFQHQQQQTHHTENLYIHRLALLCTLYHPLRASKQDMLIRRETKRQNADNEERKKKRRAPSRTAKNQKGYNTNYSLPALIDRYPTQQPLRIHQDIVDGPSPQAGHFSSRPVLEELLPPFLRPGVVSSSVESSVPVVSDRRASGDTAAAEETLPLEEPYFFIPRKFLRFFSLWYLPPSS